jgi:transposase-like protein
MEQRERRARREFSEEFKARTVELIESSGKSINEVCRELDLTEAAVRSRLARMNNVLAELNSASSASTAIVVSSPHFVSSPHSGSSRSRPAPRTGSR